MPFCKKCCYCMKLRTGCILIGAVTLLWSVAVGAVVPSLLTTKIEEMTATAEKGGIANKAAPFLKVFTGIRSAIITMSCLSVLVSVLLVVSAFAGWRWVMLPFPVFQPIYIIVLMHEANLGIEAMKEMMALASKTFDTSFKPYLYVGAVAFGLIHLVFDVYLLSYFLELGRGRPEEEPAESDKK